MSAIKWSVEAGTVVMVSELTSLSNNSGTAGTAYVNGTQLNFVADFELNCTLSGTVAAQTPIELYLLDAIDGTNYNTVAGGTAPLSAFVGSFTLTPGGTVCRTPLRSVPLPLSSFKPHIRNTSGVTINSGTLTMKAAQVQG